EAAPQLHRRGAGAAAQVDDGGGDPVAQVLERLEQPRLHLALQGGGAGIAVRRARERAADLARVEDAAHGAAAPASPTPPAPGARKPAIAAATSSAWVRKGACPPCSTCTKVAPGAASAASRRARGSTARSRRPPIHRLGTDRPPSSGRWSTACSRSRPWASAAAGGSPRENTSLRSVRSSPRASSEPKA